MKHKKEMKLRQEESEPGAAYLELHAHPHVLTPGLVKRSIDIHLLVEGYNGPRLCLDLNEHGEPIGIEVVYSTGEDESV